MLVWANLHASFPLGVALVAIFLAGRLAQRTIDRDPSSMLPLAPLAGALGTCALITLANPVGVRLWTYPLPFLFSGDPVVRYIEEWQAVDFHDPVNLVFAASLLLLGIVGLGRPARPTARRRSLARVRRRFDLTDVALVVFSGTLALRIRPPRPRLRHGRPAAARRSPRACVACGVSQSRRKSPQRQRGDGARPYARARRRGCLRPVRLLVTRRAHFGSEPRTDSRFAYPAGAATYLEGAPGARIFNEYAWGGYLLYRLYPTTSVFIDGRANLFRKGVFADYMAVRIFAPAYREVLGRTGSNVILVRPDGALATALAGDLGWRRVFEDKVSVLYRRDDGT